MSDALRLMDEFLRWGVHGPLLIFLISSSRSPAKHACYDLAIRAWNLNRNIVDGFPLIMPIIERIDPRKMPISSPTMKMLLALALPIALISAPAVAADNNGATSQLRITEVTEKDYPFETLYCARQPLQVRFIGKLAEIVVNNETRTLMQAMSASGARYVAPGDDTTVFWSKGPFATVTWSGQQLPLCAPSGAIIPPYRASGNEPFWAVAYDGWRATLKRPEESDLVRDAELAATSVQGQTLVAGEGTDAWRLEASDGLCVDSMSGMPYPQQTTLHYQSKTLHGCGGDPERLLQGVTWRVTPIGQQVVNDATLAHIRFLANNKIAGSSGCNLFFGQYTLTGEALRLKDMGSTRKACPPELMAQESGFLKMLASVSRFSFEDSDAQQLLLHSDGADIRVEAHAM